MAILSFVLGLAVQNAMRPDASRTDVQTRASSASAQPDSAPSSNLAGEPQCDPSLWAHVYAGDPRRFHAPQDRLQVIKECVQVSGVIETALKEADGDVHIRLRVDPQFSSLLNAKNISGQRGDLVLEPVCVSRPTQRDTIEEHACDNFNQTFDRRLVGRHVTVVGAYVTDMEHGWNEIHPVTSIAAEGPSPALLSVQHRAVARHVTHPAAPRHRRHVRRHSHPRRPN